MDSELREEDRSPAVVRAEARLHRRSWWIDQCRQAIADGRARQTPPEADDDENP